MKYFQTVHKFGCLGYTALGLVCSFLLVPISYPVFHFGNEQLVAVVATIEMAVISLAAAFAVAYWAKPDPLMATLIWVPAFMVSYLAVIVSYNFDGYLVRSNPFFREWLVILLSLVLYQAPLQVIYALRRRGRTQVL
jgi:hypothetical protein